MSEFLRIAKEEDLEYERYLPRLFNDFFSRIPFDNEDFNYFIKKNRIVNILDTNNKEFKFDYPEYNKINDKEFFDLAQDYFYLATKDAIYNPQEEY